MNIILKMCFSISVMGFLIRNVQVPFFLITSVKSSDWHVSDPSFLNSKHLQPVKKWWC